MKGKNKNKVGTTRLDPGESLQLKDPTISLGQTLCSPVLAYGPVAGQGFPRAGNRVYEEECPLEPSWSLLFLLLPPVPRSQHRRYQTFCYGSSDALWPNSHIHLYGMDIKHFPLGIWEGRCHKCGWIWIAKEERVPVTTYILVQQARKRRTKELNRISLCHEANCSHSRINYSEIVPLGPIAWCVFVL